MKYHLVLLTSLLTSIGTFASNDNSFNSDSQDNDGQYVKVKVDPSYLADEELTKLKSQLKQEQAKTEKLAKEKEIADLKAEIAAELEKQQEYRQARNVDSASQTNTTETTDRTDETVPPTLFTTESTAKVEDVIEPISVSAQPAEQNLNQADEDQLDRLIKNIKVEVPRALDAERIQKNIVNESNKALKKLFG